MKSKSSSILCLKLILLSLIIYKSRAESPFNSNDSVIELKENNFAEIVFNQKKISLVNFYLDWCSHCIRFSQIWKQLANDVKQWKSVVIIAAINCADDINSKICQYLGITRFPRIRLFGPNSNSDDSGIHFEVRESMIDLRNDLIDYIIKIKEYSLHFSFLSIFAETRNELINGLPDSQTINLIFLEKYPSRLPIEIILDFSSMRNHLKIIRFLDKSGLLSKDLFSHSLRLPSLIRFHKNQSFELIASGNSVDQTILRKEFSYHIKQILETEMIPFDSKLSLEYNNNGSVQIMPQIPKPVSWADIYNTLRYSLHKEVVRIEVLNTTQREVLQNYFLIVYKYLPFDNENIRRFFKRMNIWFSNKTNELKSESLRAAMKISDGYLPPMVKWIHCAGSRTHLRGYPCGLWLLFHTLTVEEYKESISANVKNSHKVLPLMRDYILNFFSCDECVKHFEHISKDLDSSLISPQSSVLWLWRIHNQVNQRIKGSPGEDPLFPKTQFPTQNMCNQCYASNNQFNETEVLKFFLNIYNKTKYTKTAEYFADQRILNKNFGQTLAENKKFGYFLPFILDLIMTQILFN